MSSPDLASVRASIRAPLLAWYDAHRRILPWRETPTPYRVWVSEIMLQQTQVETVIPYFERWMDRFESPAALADAPIDDVLALWSGLGYYRRAHFLHRAAQVIRDTHGGEIPADYDAIRALPGVGDYTAGAIASIAFGLQAPIVDGNVARVLCRHRVLEGEPLKNPVKRTLWGLARELVQGERPGDFNQALMELGATCCVPKNPACETCPIAEACLARAQGRQHELPTPKTRKARHRVITASLVIEDERGATLLVKPLSGGILKGLWAVPALELRNVRGPKRTPKDDTLPAFGSAMRAKVEAFARDSLGMDVEIVRALPPVDHTFSHIDYTAIRWQCRVQKSLTLRALKLDAEMFEEASWVEKTTLDSLGVSKLTRKILA